MTNLVQKTLQAIKEHQIHPKPRWYFIAVHGLMWMAVALAIGVGSLSCGVLIRHFVMTDWGMVGRLGGGPIRSFMIVLPYLWFLLLAVILFLAKWLFAHTEKGYRFRPIAVVASSILISFVGGFLSFKAHLDIPFERGFRNHMPFYGNYIEERSRGFVDASRGVLAGRIAEVNPEENLIVIDFRKEKWIVDIREILPLPEFVILEEGAPIGIVGEQTGAGTFKAEKILPPPPFFENSKNERKRPLMPY